jgi:hypothetical protein
MIYKLLKDEKTNIVNYVELTDDNNKKYCIPFDPANTDYQAYLKWVEAGGVPEAADEPA